MNEEQLRTCPICLTQPIEADWSNHRKYVQCPVCGPFVIAAELNMDLWEARRAIPGSGQAVDVLGVLERLSIAIRHAPEPPLLKLSNWRELANDAPRFTVDEKVDRLVQELAAGSSPGRSFEYGWNGVPFKALLRTCGARDLDEGRFLLGALEEHGLASVKRDSEGFRGELTSLAWRALEEQREKRPSGACFVAMWFADDDEMKDVWSVGFEPGIKKAGLTPRRVDKVDHVNKICDQIAIEIEAAEIVIADVSGFRSGVFFEAGYATALGKPVMWTCRQDFYADLGDHFDTRQYHHFRWQAPADLAELVAVKLPIFRELKPAKRSAPR